MALDGAFLACLRQELWDALPDARVDKIHQPSREELVLLMRYRGGAERLYLSARAHSPRVHFTENVPENPASPPMFCMLLRKRLSGGRLVAIRQNGWERALYFDFDCVNELGDIVRLTLRRFSVDKFMLLLVPLMVLAMSLVDNFFFYLNFQIPYAIFLMLAERIEHEQTIPAPKPSAQS